MSEATFQESSPPQLTSFPRVLYYPRIRLLTWHPVGVLDDGLLHRAADFLEAEEAKASEAFNRYVDLNGVTELRIRFGDTLELTERRRASYSGPRVQSAIFCSRPVGFGVARMYASLMQGSAIEAQAFGERGGAALWLGVPLESLCPAAGCFDAQPRVF